ncbi:MAG: AbrB/MazE/SpoVT family DNA-binding domain-containing protein [Microcoleus sp. PH2017_10_PVI_O_A]|uniref:AbrB/MazE/SpoVT family DNA-binding domain-containing protein n=1 Tax=unclassified Microcoleus TaxID=2642155 RepID=UPI001D1AC40E|nr:MULTISPECIES: AbrB/MazE/SpoVT family DNA-binding domain-containing protein [unclassified Microcoleus]TAE79870.1 MAG: AbrB/MazE/SpoVT family DNA-binding domain-containing protein [Oscillatoriales cyanobacterium]MCC3407910.1 AbrB/MazE/SpoVT family DNA-binding domain-containing protein [Microcoleus sp. PH2017_10_PVI_O_A]MCC3462046.1 AbrB/MazE/SpoVT family DNA-binding domain-containing protein [Microcoleus sp. PH2017_11_PCY_U_A]MCC3480514.1 AbrB/MazE/SpoVT family DNA-binding domain-containing pr
MSKSIQTQIIKVDQSQGIRIPKSLLEQIGISEEVEIEVQGDRIVIRAAAKPRAGWDEAFAKMAEQHDDVLLDDVTTTEWDQRDWEW